MEYSFEMKIPNDRIGALIGKEGKTKQELEDQTEAEINVDSDDGTVEMIGEDSLKLYNLKSIVKAIGRGFNPKIAKLLLRQDYSLELLKLMDYVQNKNHMRRVKGRIIGKKGKSRETIEEMTDTFVSVYGKTVGLIGEPSKIVIAKKAIESLALGSPHSNVYKYLEKNQTRLKQQDMKDWY